MMTLGHWERVVKGSTCRYGSTLRALLAAAIGSAIVVGGLPRPALAHDDWYGDGWRRHEWREHEWREREWREHEWRRHHRPYVYGYPGYYAPAPVIVESPPPPVIYSPPPAYYQPQPGLGVFFHFN